MAFRVHTRFFTLSLLLAPAVVQSQQIFEDGFEGCHQSCSTELTCPTQQAGKACVSGRLIDMQSNQPICTLPASVATCNGSGDGPCALTLRVYDALEFVQNPAGAAALTPAENLVDGCGRFRLSGFSKPTFGFGLVAVDDAPASPDLHVLSAGIRPMPDGAEVDQVRLFAVRHTTDQAWTASAGNPFGGATFAQSGTYAAIFQHGGTPVAGVAFRSDGSAVSGSDYYFADTDSSKRETVDTGLAATGVNGSGLFVTSSITLITGEDGAPDDCSWPMAQGGSTPGLVVVHEFNAELSGQAGVACP
jgi:hypothetical protein